MLVSNLGPEVTDEDLEELFTDHGGPVKKAEVFYKQDGSSTGQAVSIRREAPRLLLPSSPCFRAPPGNFRVRRRGFVA